MRESYPCTLPAGPERWLNRGMAKRKKSKDQLLFEDGYAAGLKGAHEIQTGDAPMKDDDKSDIEIMMAVAWARQKRKMIEESKKLEESDITLAQEAWLAAGKPTEGVLFRESHYFFNSDGSFNTSKTFNANFEMEAPSDSKIL